MALKVTLFGHHFVSLPYIYLFRDILLSIVISGFTCNNNNNNNSNNSNNNNINDAISIIKQATRFGGFH